MAVEKRPIVFIFGAPEWLVTFGDMMSLLLTFFILLFSVAQMKDAGKVYDMIYALQGMVSGSRPLHGYLLPDYNAVVDNLLNESETQKRNFGERGVHSSRVQESEGDGYHSLRVRDQVKISFEGNVFFEEGEKVLLEEGRKVLGRLLVPKFQDGPYRIVIRGHCAAGEAATPDAQDDLGFQRAREVRDFFVEKGIPPGRFELQTMGARGEAPSPDMDPQEERRQRRSVEIFVSPQATGVPIEN